MPSDQLRKQIENIQKRLQEPLPGENAHTKMASSNRLNVKFKPNERTRKSAVLILFYPFLDEVFMPLILRPMYDGVHGGQMAFPGGRMERSDENLIRTALREAQEEIGVKLNDIQILGRLSQLYIPPSNFFVQPVVGYIPYRPTFYPDEREVDKIVEVSLSEIMDESIISMEQLHVRGVNIEAPAYNIQENKVWGATAMMIAELLEIINEM
jgi:8-oxo-dGTP pyrophosphatase MutT (NUDIX family)